VTLRTRAKAFASFCVLACLSWGPAAAAQGIDPAERQLSFCWSELEGGDYERARASANSALRLDPSQYEAMVCKAEAYVKEDQLERARSVMGAYVEVRLGLAPSARALAVMEVVGLAADGTRIVVEPPEDDDDETDPADTYEEPPESVASPAPMGIGPGVGVAAVGGGLAGVGAALHGGSWTNAQPGADGEYAGTVEEFDGLLGANRGGLGMLIGGSAAVAAGVVVAIIGARQGGKAAPEIAAVAVPVPGGIALSFGGTW
jgi:hypothetical protein